MSAAPLLGRWTANSGPDLLARTERIIRNIAKQFQEPDAVHLAVYRAKQQTRHPKTVRWRPPDIAQGDAGLALMFSYLDLSYPDEGFDELAHERLRLAAAYAEQETGPFGGAFGGLAGFAFVVWYASRGTPRYRALLEGIERILLPVVTGLADQIRQSDHGMSVSLFDVISGVAGMGGCLLCRLEEAPARTALESILRALVWLAENPGDLPRWYTPHALIGDESVRGHYPAGNLNCGLAHGIPGPLALLALAYRRGVRVEGHAAAIETIADWLAQNRLDDAWGVNWPTAVALTQTAQQSLVAGTSKSARFGPSRSAWCYGPPGIARALWLSGEALGADRYRDLALEAMAAVYRRPIQKREIDSPTFCHGVSGLLQISLRFANDTGLPIFREAVSNLHEQLLDLYDPEARFGYFCLEPGGNRVDQPGLLDGAAGVLLVLLAATGKVEPAWDRLFLIS